MTLQTRLTADEMEERAARWLLRREEPGWSAEDRAALDAWLAESMAHKAAYWRLEYGWRKADRLAALGPLTDAEVRAPRRQWIATLSGLAAAACLAVTILVVTGIRPDIPGVVSARQRLETPVGGYQRLPLKDGSQIELNTATAVRIELTETRREIWLDQGEAYFEVAHDSNRPFIVHAGPRSVTVLGTKFLVRREGDGGVVGVVEGRVRVDQPRRANAQVRSTMLTKGEMAIARGNSTSVISNAVSQVEASLAWRHGMITLDHATVAEAIAEFNRYNDRKIVVTDPQVLSVRVGGTFQTSSVDAFVYLLREAYDLQVAIEVDDTTISQ